MLDWLPSDWLGFGRGFLVLLGLFLTRHDDAPHPREG